MPLPFSQIWLIALLLYEGWGMREFHMREIAYKKYKERCRKLSINQKKKKDKYFMEVTKGKIQ